MFELPASFPVLLSDVTVIQGDHALFTCKVCGRPRPTVTWRAPDGTILTSGKKTFPTVIATIISLALKCALRTFSSGL